MWRSLQGVGNKAQLAGYMMYSGVQREKPKVRELTMDNLMGVTIKDHEKSSLERDDTRQKN